MDVWELGILMYYLAFFSTPFESVDGKIDTRSLIAGRFTFPANESKMYSAEFLEIIRRLLTADVSKWAFWRGCEADGRRSWRWW